jgi:hypothetical protein
MQPAVQSDVALAPLLPSFGPLKGVLFLESINVFLRAPERALVCASHGKARGNPISFDDHFFEGPLDVREAASHHCKDREISIGTSHRLRARDVENCAGGNELDGHRFTGRVDELQKTLHDLSCRFSFHATIGVLSRTTSVASCCVSI